LKAEIAAEHLLIGQEPNQIPKAAAKPIDTPGGDHIDLAPRGVFQ
jgi:hypothetical protein